MQESGEFRFEAVNRADRADVVQFSVIATAEYAHVIARNWVINHLNTSIKWDIRSARE